MKPDTILNLAGGVIGLVAATWWYRAGTVPVDRLFTTVESMKEGYAALTETKALTEAFNKSAGLNKTAAFLTAVSVLLEASAAHRRNLGQINQARDGRCHGRSL